MWGSDEGMAIGGDAGGRKDIAFDGVEVLPCGLQSGEGDGGGGDGASGPVAVVIGIAYSPLGGGGGVGPRDGGGGGCNVGNRRGDDTVVFPKDIILEFSVVGKAE